MMALPGYYTEFSSLLLLKATMPQLYALLMPQLYATHDWVIAESTQVRIVSISMIVYIYNVLRSRRLAVTLR